MGKSSKRSDSHRTAKKAGKAGSKRTGPKTKKSKKTPAKKAVKAKKPQGKTNGKATRPKQKKKKGEDLMCFLTNACVKYYGLPDNCYELNTLRRYRDTYLYSHPEGISLVKEYYRVAPQIVALANNDISHRKVYDFIYSQIRKACREIEESRLARAKHTYKNLVTSLINRYHISS